MHRYKPASTWPRCLVGLAFMASTAAMATPELDTGALYDYLPPPRATFTKQVRNLGDATAFVKVEVAEITYNDQDAPAELPLEGTERPLVASPSRLIIPAGSRRDVRVVYRGGRLSERYFRLRFVPVVPESEDAFGVREEEREHYRQAIKASVGVLKAIGGVVLVSPQPPRFNTQVEQRGASLRVANNGNTTVILDNFARCQAGGECAQGHRVHVRPGKTFSEQTEEGQGFSFTLIEGNARRRYTP